MITAEQVRMARAAVGLGVRDLANLANVATSTIARFETGKGGLQANTMAAIQKALEAAGVEFIAENGGGPGVRLRKVEAATSSRRMHVFRLSPVNQNDFSWEWSNYVGEAVIRAEDEQTARAIAARAFRIPGEMSLGEDGTIVWLGSEHVSCEVITDGSFVADGPRAILDPADRDGDWSDI